MDDCNLDAEGLCLRSYGADYAGSPHHRAHQEAALARLAGMAPADALDHYADCPTVDHTHEPWTDDDTAELAREMADAAWRTTDRHSEARAGGHIALHGLPRVAPIIRRWSYWQAIERADRVADRMGDDPQPTDLPIIQEWRLDVRGL